VNSLQELIDHNEIQSQIIRIAAMLDNHDFPTATSIFTDDVAIETPGGTASGVGAATAQAKRNHAKFTTQHLISNVLIDLAGDAAQARADVLATFIAKDDPSKSRSSVSGSYSYGFTRTDEGWRVSELKMRPLWNDLHAAA
jgi:ketosteroid isomerase-like protein